MKLLISAYSGLGNTIQLTALIQCIKSSRENHEIFFISDDKYSQNEILIDEEVKTLKFQKTSVKSFIEIYRLISKERFDIIFLPFIGSPGWLLILSVALLKPKIFTHIQKMEFSKLFILKYFFKLFVPNFKSVKFDENRSEIETYKDLLFATKEFSASAINCMPSLSIKNNVFKQPFLDINDEYVCFQYGVYNGRPSPKMWIDDNCYDFFTKFLKKYPKKKLVLLGDGEIKESFPTQPRLINLIKKTSINELKIIVKNAKLIISMDSALMHFANALNVPLIAIYGPTNSARTFPKKEGNFKIQSKYHDNGQCDLMAKLPETKAIEVCEDCKQFMKDISASDVLKFIEEKKLLN